MRIRSPTSRPPLSCFHLVELCLLRYKLLSRPSRQLALPPSKERAILTSVTALLRLPLIHSSHLDNTASAHPGFYRRSSHPADHCVQHPHPQSAPNCAWICGCEKKRLFDPGLYTPLLQRDGLTQDRFSCECIPSAPWLFINTALQAFTGALISKSPVSPSEYRASQDYIDFCHYFRLLRLLRRRLCRQT